MADDTKQYIKDFANKQATTNKLLKEIIQALDATVEVGDTQTEAINSVAFEIMKDYTSVSAEVLLTAKGSLEGVGKGVEDAIVGYMNADKSVAQAIRKTGNEDLKRFLIDQQIERLRANEQFVGQYDKQIEALQNSAENFDWTGMATRAESLLFPVIESAKDAVNDIRHAFSEAPILNRFVSDAMVEHYKTGLKEIQGVFQKHLSPILEPISMLTGPFTGLVKSMFIVGKTLMTGPTPDEKAAAKAQVETADILREQLTILKGDRLKKDVPKKEEKLWLMLGAILFTIGAAIGGYIGSFLKPLKLMLNGINFVVRKFSIIAKSLDKIGDVFNILKTGAITRLGKFFELLGKFKIPNPGSITKWFTKTGGFFTKVLPRFFDLFKTFAKGFAFGMKFIAWPLRIIMSVVDFVKGFVATDGNVAQKIIGGLKEVVIGLVEFPMRAMAWVWDKTVGNILSLFGVEISADSMVTRVLDTVGSFFDGLGKMFGGGMEGILNGLISMWNSIVTGAEKLINKIPLISADFSGAKLSTTKPSVQPPLEMMKTHEPLPSSAPTTLAKVEAQNRQQKSTENMTAAVNQNTATVRDSVKEYREAITQVNTVVSTDSGSSRRRDDIPTTIESAPLLFATQSWGAG